MIITQEIKDLCRNDARLRFQDMNSNVQTLLAEARGQLALQYLRLGIWEDAFVYTQRVEMCPDHIYRIDPEFPVSTTDKKETMKITAKELAECQNADKRVYAELPQIVRLRMQAALPEQYLQFLDLENKWKTSGATFLHDGVIYRIDPKTPITEDKKPEFVDYPVSIRRGVYHFSRPETSYIENHASTAPSYVDFRCFVYTTKSDSEYVSSYLCPQVGTLKAIRFRNT